MHSEDLSTLQAQLALARESIQKLEERATAGQLALEIMHEIRNPLEALGHFVYLASEEADSPGKVRRYMRQAEEQMATLNQIAGQTLGFARASHSPLQMDLVAVTEAALRIHQRTIETKKIQLVKLLPKTLIARVYTGQILQVISNIVVNALEAMPPRGRLTVRLRQRNSAVHFLIVDNGHGITREHLPEIFEPFFTTGKEHGNGFGLALSKNIIERHHGRIQVRSSVAPGRSGTTFRVSLPL